MHQSTSKISIVRIISIRLKVELYVTLINIVYYIDFDEIKNSTSSRVYFIGIDNLTNCPPLRGTLESQD